MISIPEHTAQVLAILSTESETESSEDTLESGSWSAFSPDL